MVLGKLDSYMLKNEIQTFFNTIQKTDGVFWNKIDKPFAKLTREKLQISK